MNMQITIDSKSFDDKDMLFDCITSQNNVIKEYVESYLSSSSISIKEKLVNLLDDEIIIEQSLFLESQNRKLFCVKQADKDEIDKLLSSLETTSD
ncbi:MAG: hypothetical protein RR497_05530 [Oscillospiraceae bacterium]